ncbi:hypothetical protein JMK10_13580, partial [Rhodovulum sulfidophilum]
RLTLPHHLHLFPEAAVLAAQLGQLSGLGLLPPARLCRARGRQPFNCDGVTSSSRATLVWLAPGSERRATACSSNTAVK